MSMMAPISTRPISGGFADGPGRVTVRRSQGIASAASWAELVYALVDLAPAMAFFAGIVTLLCLGAGLLVIYAGIPILMAALLLARLGGALQIGLARSLLAMPVPLPGPFRRRSSGLGGAIGAVLRDGAAWRAVLYFLVKIVVAPATFTVAVTLYGYGLGAVTYPVWRPFLPAVQVADGSRHSGAMLWDGYVLDTWPAMGFFAVAGLLVLLVAPRLLRWFITADRLLIGALLAPRPVPAGPAGPSVR